MPIFEANGKKYNVKDEYLDAFAKDYPDAVTYEDREGKRYRVKSKDYNSFISQFDKPSEPVVATPIEDNSEFEENQRLFAEGKPTKGVTTQSIIGAHPELGLQPKQYSEEVLQRSRENVPDYFKSKKDVPLVDRPLGTDAPIGSDERLAARVDIAKKNLEDAEYQKDLTKNQLRRLSDRVSENLNELGGRVNTGIDRFMPANMQYMPTNPVNQELMPEYTALRKAQRLVEESQNIIDEASKKGNTNFMAGLARGFWDNLNAEDYTFGADDAAQSAYLYQALNKAEKGEKLTKAEETLLDAAVINMATQAYYAQDLGRGYGAGSVTAESIPFMLEMAINPISSAGKASAKALLKYGLKKFGSKAVNKAVKAGTRLATDALSSVGMAATTGAGDVLEGATDRMAKNYNYGFDENGRLKVDKKEDTMGFGEALGRSFATRAIENQSEMIFRAFDGAGALLKGVDKYIPGGVNTFFDAVKNSKVGQLWRGIKNSPIRKEFMEATKVGGIAEEYLEEVYNNFANVALGEMTMEKALDLDNNIDTFLGLVPTQLFFSMLGLGGMGVDRYKNRRDINRAFGNMSNEQQKKLKALQEMGRLKENKDIAAFLRETMLADNLTQEEKRSEIEYLYNVAKGNAIDEIDNVEIQDAVDAENADIDSKTDTSTGMYAEAVALVPDGEGGVVEQPGNIVGYIGGQPIFVPEGMENTEENRIILKPGDLVEGSIAQAPSEEVKASNEEMIRDEAEAQAELESRYAPEVLNAQMVQGQPIDTPSEQIIPISPMPEGNGWIVEVYAKDTNNKVAAKPEVKEMTTDEFRDILQAQLDAEEATIKAEQAVIEEQQQVTPQAEEIVAEQPTIATEEAAQPVMEEANPQAPVIPTKQDGSIDFVAYGKEGSIKELGNQYGEKMPHKVAVTAKAFADDVVKAKENLDKANEALDNAPIGREQKAKEAQINAQQAYEAVKNEADFWAEMDADIKAAQAEREAMLNPQVEVDMSEQPMTVDEFVAQQLANGNITLTSESFKKETGYGEKERKKFPKMFRKAENGGMSIERAGERLMEIAAEEGLAFFDQEDANSGRDALINFLGSVYSWGDITGYVRNNREAMAKKESEAVRDEMESFIWNAFHMTPEEYATQREIEAVENPYENVDLAAIDAIFAEKEFESQTLNQETNESGRIAEGNQGESGILSEEQVGDNGGNQPSEEERNAEGTGNGAQDESETAQEPELTQKEGESVLDFAARVAEEQRRKPLRERAREWSEALGVDVVMLERTEEITDERTRREVEAAHAKGNTVPGWVTNDGKVYFLMSDISNIKDVDETYIHEVVAHIGLKNLLGKERFAELCDKVWEMMPKSAQDYYMSYPGVKNHRDAADEYIAHLAEKQNLTPEEKTIWDNIVKAFRELLDKALDGIIGKAKLTDKDIAELIRASYANLKSGAESGDVVTQLKNRTTETPSGNISFSIRTAESWVDNLGHSHKGTIELVGERMKKMGFTKSEIKDMESKMKTAYDYMVKLSELTGEDGSVRFEEFNEWAKKTPMYKQIGRNFVKAITSLVSNGDYPINLELTTDCIKREAYTQLLNTLVKRGAQLANMSPAEIVTIQKLMKQYGIEVACELCFVEGKRLQIVNWASQIVNDWNDALAEAGVSTDEYFEFGKDGQAFIPSEEWKTHEDKAAVAKVQKTLDDVQLLFNGIDPKTWKSQKAKNKKAVEKFKKAESEKWAKKNKKDASQWVPNKDQEREIRKLETEGLAPTYVSKNTNEYKKAFEEMRAEWVEKNPKKDPLSFEPTKAQWAKLDSIRNQQISDVKKKMVRLIMEYPDMRKKMTLNDLLGSNGLMEIRQQHGAAYEQLYSIILQRFGTGTPKPVQDAAPYDGEVMTLSTQAYANANKIGGARLFSFSDFDITKVFDYMQMFFDLEANKQRLQSYTKEVGAIIIFGRSNGKFNISTLANAVVPESVKAEYKGASDARKKELRHEWAENAGLAVDEEGNITGINFSAEHSVSPEFAQQIFHDDSRNKDCGAIMVGASVNHAIYSAAQDWIRMVIPFHLSGMPIAAREKTDVLWYTDNTEYQSTRKKTSEGWKKISSNEDTFSFYDTMEQEGWNMRDKAKEYLAWCESKGFRPKFDWGINSEYYRAYCAENGYTPNQQLINLMDADTTDGVWNQYYKFLTDFTAYKPVFDENGNMVDEIPSPQHPIVTNFDFSELEKDVLFEGENSLLAHREENIKKTQSYLNEIADKVEQYLSGEVSEEELNLKENVFYDNSADAERYLNALSEGTRFRFIGEKGAANLDKAEEATTRLDNLAVAKEMEAAEKDAKAIKMATGWERGADGLWRYEVADNLNFDYYANVDYRNRHPELARFEDLRKKLNSSLLMGTEALTEEEQKEFDALEKEFGGYKEYHNSRKLKDYLDAPELFEAYPELRNVELRFIDMDKGTLGKYLPGENTIVLNNSMKLSGRLFNEQVLVHEIQHAIQHIEGFEPGANKNMQDPNKVAQKIHNREFMQKQLDKHIAERDELLKQKDVLNEKMAAWYDSHEEGSSFDDEMNEYNRQYDEIESKLEAADRKVLWDEKWLDATKKAKTELGEEGYAKVTGEVEARNVSRRMRMSDADRRNTLASETEDVAREDQIFLKDGIESGMRFRISDKARQLQDEVDNFTSKYNSKPVVVVESSMTDKKLKSLVGFDADEVRDAISKGLFGGYNPNTEKIYIFNDNIKDISALEDTLFHENLHQYLLSDKSLVVEFFTDAEDAYKKNIKQIKEQGYKAYEVPEELFVRVVADSQVKGNFAKVFSFLSEEGKEKLTNLLKENGYDIARETEIRTSGRMDGSGRDGSGRRNGDDIRRVAKESSSVASPSKVEKDGRAREIRQLFDQVADNGLRGVVGDKAYDSAMFEMYRSLPMEARERVAMDALNNHGADMGKAMDKFIGESYDTSLWDVVVGAIRNMLRKKGYEISFSENDIRYLVWRNRQKLNRESILDVAEDIDTRYRLKVGEYEGSPTDGEDAYEGDDNVGVRFRVVTDASLIEELESSDKRIGYRNVVLNEDGSFGSPMADKLGKTGGGKKKTSGFELGKWEQAEENPDLVDENGKIDLIKPDGKQVKKVDYNPYIHNRLNCVNRQFKQAWERPDLVYVETEIPVVDLESGYHADKAKKPVGEHKWNGGNLILSRYDKPIRIVGWEEVADDWEEAFKNKGVHFDIVPPALLPILASRGIKILPPHKGMGEECNKVYQKFIDNTPDGGGTRFKIKNGTYKSKDGKETKYKQLSLLFDGWNEAINDGIGSDRIQRKDNSDLKALNSLRKLEDGEMCNVERKFTESGEFSFTRGERIESVDDIAYIFKSLEDEAIENSFVALTKGDDVTVIHLGMGQQASTTVDTSAIIAAVNRLGAEKVFFVHNHPSGNVKCSRVDVDTYRVLKDSLGDKLQEGIIINTRSGEYGLFNDNGAKGSNRSMKNNQDEYPIKIYKFNKQSFLSHEIHTVAPHSYGIAEFVSTQRLGKRDKINALLLNNNFDCVGNVFISENDINSKNIKDVLDKLSMDAIAMGANAVVIYGRSPFVEVSWRGTNFPKYMSDGLRMASVENVKLLDIIQIDESFNRSAADEGVRFRVSNQSPEQKKIDKDYLNAVHEGDFKKAIDLFRDYVLIEAQERGVIPIDYAVGYETESHSNIAKKLKEENPIAISEAAFQMSKHVPKGSILIPMPSRIGHATYTLKLAEAIARSTNSEVMDILKGKERTSVYESKKKGIIVDSEDLGLYLDGELPKGKNVIVVDNVIDRGITSLAAVKAVKGASVLAYAYTEENKDKIAPLKLSDPITYDDEYRIIPLSERFNPKSNDVRFRVNDVSNKLKIRDEYEATIRKGGYQAREAVQDAMLSLRRVQEMIEKVAGKKLRSFENAWMHENRLSSVVQSAIHEMERKFNKPMLDAVKKLMKAADLEQEQVADYLMLKHGIERNREMAVRKALTDSEGKIDRAKLEQWHQEKDAIRNDANLDTWRKKQEAMDNAALNYGADMSRDYSGLTSMFDTDDLADSTDRAYKEVEALETAHPAETEALGKAVKAMTQNTLDKSFESGLMDRKVYNELSKNMYDYYIPLRGFEETTSDEVYAYMDNDRGAFNAPLKRAKGRSSKSDNPIAYLKSIAESGIMQGERNKMKQTFLNMVINHPTDLVSVKEGVWVVYNPATGEWEAASMPNIPANATPADVENILEQWEANMEQLAANDPNVKKVAEADDIPYRVIGNRLNQHQIIVKRLGKSYTLTVNGNPRLAMALNGMTNPNNTSNDSKALAYVNGKIGDLNRFLASVYTTKNPDFVASNFMRDTFYTNTIVRAKEGNKYANKFHKNYAELLMPGKMISLFSKYEKGTLDPTNKMEAAFMDFMKNGGETGYSNLKDLEEIKKQISKELKGSRFAKVEAVMEKLDLLNRAVENTARFAAYLTSRSEGRDIARSIFDAKEISVNFNKKGAGGTFFGSTGQTKFGNVAAMVGAGGRALYVFFNAAVQGTTNLMHVMRINPKGTSAGIAAMFLMGAVLPFLYDDDDEKDYYDLPEHVRRSNLIIPGAGDAWISIPLPIEYRIMYGMGELLTSWRTGHERGSDIARKMLNLTGQALPLNFIEEGFEAFVPSAISPLWQAYNNESWTGLPIYKDNEFNKNDPEYTKAYKNVDKLIYNTTKALYEWTFDEENQKARINLNPAIIESLAKGYFGGYTTQLSNIGKTLETVMGDREFDWRSIPVANRVFKSGDERTKEKRITNEYFENIEKMEFLQARERLLKKTINGTAVPEVDKEKAKEDLKVMQGTDIYKKYMKFKDIKKDVDKIRKKLKAKGSDEELERKQSETQEKANKAVR